MASDVPVKELRPLADWRDQLGLDRLRADLINGDLDAWYYDPLTGQWHQIPRAHWQGKVAGKDALEHALGWGWGIGGSIFSPGVPFRACPLRAARPVLSATPTATDSHPGAAAQPPPPEQRRTPPGWAQKQVIPKLHEKFPPAGIPPGDMCIREVCSQIGVDPESKWKTVKRALLRLGWRPAGRESW